MNILYGYNRKVKKALNQLSHPSLSVQWIKKNLSYTIKSPKATSLHENLLSLPFIRYILLVLTWTPLCFKNRVLETVLRDLGPH